MIMIMIMMIIAAAATTTATTIMMVTTMTMMIHLRTSLMLKSISDLIWKLFIVLFVWFSVFSGRIQGRKLVHIGSSSDSRELGPQSRAFSLNFTKKLANYFSHCSVDIFYTCVIICFIFLGPMFYSYE